VLVGGSPKQAGRARTRSIWGRRLAGFVGVALDGNVVVDTIVAQLPAGEPMFVTRGERNVIFELDGYPAVLARQRPRQLPKRPGARPPAHCSWRGHAERQQNTAKAISSATCSASPKQAAWSSARRQENQVVQFHLRDAKTPPTIHPVGALSGGARVGSFSCLGRGQHLYGRPDHDTDVFHAALGDVALGGFFCNGEIGPVQGRTFLHGYTSAFGLFRPRR
jgi:small ligand-binding sensory domain FIST